MDSLYQEIYFDLLFLKFRVKNDGLYDKHGLKIHSHSDVGYFIEFTDADLFYAKYRMGNE